MRILYLLLAICLVISCTKCIKITHQSLDFDEADISTKKKNLQPTELQLYQKIPNLDEDYFEGFSKSSEFKTFSFSILTYTVFKNLDSLQDVCLAMIRQTGWTKVGVRAKSIASSIHSWIGNVPKGHWFSKLQSLGVKGVFKTSVAWGVKLLPWVAGGIAIGVAGYYAYNYFWAEDQSMEGNLFQDQVIHENQKRQQRDEKVEMIHVDLNSSKKTQSPNNQSNSIKQALQTSKNSTSSTNQTINSTQQNETRWRFYEQKKNFYQFFQQTSDSILGSWGLGIAATASALGSLATVGTGIIGASALPLTLEIGAVVGGAILLGEFFK